jgi:hypothetical protein
VEAVVDAVQHRLHRWMLATQRELLHPIPRPTHNAAVAEPRDCSPASTLSS